VRTHRATVLFGVLAAGLVLTQQACTSFDRQSDAPVAFTAPTTTSTQATGTKTSSGTKTTGGTKTSTAGKKTAVNPILAGKRQIVIKPVQSSESIVVVDARGRLSLTDGEAEYGMFVLTPVGDEYLIKTAKAGAGGEPSCLGVKNNGSASLTVVATGALSFSASSCNSCSAPARTTPPPQMKSGAFAFLRSFAASSTYWASGATRREGNRP
jgi:hypothetical protein